MASFLRRSLYVPSTPPAEDDPVLARARQLVSVYAADPDWDATWFRENWFHTTWTPSHMKELYAAYFKDGGGAPVRIDVLTRSSIHSALVEYTFPNGRLQAVSLSVEADAPHKLRSGLWHAVQTTPPAWRGLSNPYTNQVAIRHLTAAASLRPDAVAVRVMLADALLEAGDWAAAERLASERLARAPDDLGAKAVLARLHLERDEFDAAIELLRDVAAGQPDSVEARLRLGRGLRLAGRLDEALVELRAGRALGKARGLEEEPAGTWIEECKRLIALDAALEDYVAGRRAPAGAEETVDLARLCALRGLHGRAAALWEEAFSLRGEGGVPEDPHSGVRREAARAAVRAARKADADGDRKTARRLVRRAFDWLGRGSSRWSSRVRHEDAPHRRPRGSAGARAALLRWKQDPVLAPIRDGKHLVETREADRLRASQFWTDIENLLAETDA
jgi:tetratricopeptide (TPR) repeat protein